MYYCIRERRANNKKHLCVLFCIHIRIYIHYTNIMFFITEMYRMIGWRVWVVGSETQRTTCSERAVDKMTIRIFMHDPR